jgi:hypothetical protein
LNAAVEFSWSEERVRLVLSALIGLLWTLQAQSQELDSPDLLATANIPRLNQTEVHEKSSEPVTTPQIAQAPAAQTAQVSPPSAKSIPAKQPAQAPVPPPPPPPVNPGPQVNSKVSLENFTWGADSRYRIQLYVDGKGLQFRGDLRADSRTEFTKDRLTIGIRHFPQDFLILAVSVDNDMYAHVFLIEASGASKENPFRILNSRSIRAHKEGVMDEMEGMIAAFKKVSGFDVAQAMRKTAEYFAQNPNKKAKDLFDSIEKEEAFVKVLAKPKTTGGDNGIVTPEVAQSPAQTRRPGQALDLRPNVAPPAPDDDAQDSPQQAWQKQQRARAKAERDRQQRAQRQQQAITGYDVYGRPIYGNQQGGQIDPGTGGYYRRQYQTPNYPQPQQPPPGYYRQNPYF